VGQNPARDFLQHLEIKTMATFPKIILFFITIQAAIGSSIADLSDDDLFEGLNGGRVEGYSDAALYTELGGLDAVRLVKRCMAEERLKKMLFAFPDHITDQALKDEVIEFVLREPGVWLADEISNPMDQSVLIQTNHFARYALREAFRLEGDAAELPELQKSLHKKSTRLLIANLYNDLTSLSEGKRIRGTPEMNAAVEDLRQILAGAKPSKLASRKEAQSNSAISSSNPPSSPSAGQSETGHAVGRSVAWISAALVLLLGIAGFFAFRRKAA